MENMETNPQGQGSSGAGKWIVGIVILALIVWAVWANGKKPKTTENSGNKQVAGQNYKIGVILPLTGDAAVYGEPLKNSIALATEEINAQGGIKLEMIYEDGKCNGKDATSAAQKLVNVDKVQAILGGGCSGESLAALPVAEPAKVVMASGLSTNPKLTGASSYFFRLAPSDSAQGTLDADLATKKGYKTIVALVEQTDYASGVFGVFNDAYTKAGGKVVKEEYPSENGDFRTQLTKLKAANGDAFLLVAQSSTAASKILKQMRDMNWKPQMIITESLTSDSQFLTDNKDALQNAYGADFSVDANSPNYKKFAEAYKAKYGKELQYGNFSSAFYDLTYLFRDGITKVGYNGEKLAQWSRTIKNSPGALGNNTIKPDGDSESAYKLKVVKDGKLTEYTE